MIRVLIVGVLMLVSVVGAAVGTVFLLAPSQLTGSDLIESILNGHLTQTVSVPIIRSGTLDGYVIVRLNFIADNKAYAAAAIKPEVYLVDALFKRLYTDKNTDFKYIRPIDLDAVIKEVRDAANAHYDKPVIKELMIDSFGYRTPAELSKT